MCDLYAHLYAFADCSAKITAAQDRLPCLRCEYARCAASVWTYAGNMKYKMILGYHTVRSYVRYWVDILLQKGSLQITMVQNMYFSELICAAFMLVLLFLIFDMTQHFRPA